MSRRGQISIEVFAVVGFVLAITIPFMYGVLNDLNERTRIERNVEKATEIAHAIETVSNLGPGNSIVINSGDEVFVESNVLYYGGVGEEFVSIPLLPSINDFSIGDGQAAIVNYKGNVVLFSSPVITSVPESAGMGDTISLIGEYFDDTTNIYFNGVLASSNLISDTEISFEITSNIVNPGGQIILFPVNSNLFVAKDVGGISLQSETREILIEEEPILLEEVIPR